MNPTTDTHPLQPTDFDALEDILDALRTRDEDVPQWEFLEGAMAALLCTRRPVMPAEYLPVLIGVGEGASNPFDDEAQAQRFMALWTRRWNELAAALQADVDALDEERAYQPEVMDVRGAVACLPEAERAAYEGEPLPAFGQLWALGFLSVVEDWAEEWALPRDRETAAWIAEALDAIVALVDDDTAPPAFNLHDEDGPPSVSEARAEAFGEAVWAVYDLHRIWHSLGPRTEPVRKDAAPGRNDPCPCGSGRKYKHCHGAQ
jgi:uncharacterized protein